MFGIISVLIVSNYGTFTEGLINKLNKEGRRIFTLIGDKFATKPDKVFEQYRFSYESDSINEILAGCRPDIIIFAGVYDPFFTWTERTEAQDSRTFIIGLNNLLMGARDQGIRHFVYLSSECVFQDSYTGDIAEITVPSPSSIKATTVAQGEALVSEMGRFSSLEVTVVRVGDMYFIPKERSECRDPYTLLCLEALNEKSIRVNAEILRSPLYIGDVIHALFLLISAPKRKHRVYHISSEQEVTELDVARVIEAASAEPVTVIEEFTESAKRTVLSGRRFAEEFDFQVRMDYTEAIPRIVSHMENHHRQFDLVGGRKWTLPVLWKKAGETLGYFFPIIECVGLFLIIFFLNFRAMDISYLRGVDLYLLFVLLFAVIRGRAMAIIAFALAVIGYYYQQAQVQGALALVMNMETYIWIAEVFLVGITVGYLRDKLTSVKQEKDEDNRFFLNRIEEISFINATNTKIKNYFQERVIDSNESIGWFYNIISQLDKAAVEEVVFIATGFLSRVMGTKDVAIYTVSGKDYCRLMASTTSRARSLGQSIYMDNYEGFFQPLKDGQIFINRGLDESLPSMADALLDADGEAQMFFFLWDLPYERMTLYYSNTLKVLSSLVHNAMLRAADYLEAVAHKRLVPGTKILLEDAFIRMWSIYKRTSNKQLMEYSMLLVPRGDLSVAEWDKKLERLLRQEDIIGLLPDERLGILLTNTGRDEVEAIVERMEAEGISVNTVAE